MDYSLLFPGRFLKSAEFQGRDVTLAISKVYAEEMEDQKGTKKKGIITFNGTKKELVLNRTNAECIKAMFGRETNDWIGKRVTFFPAPYHDNTTGEDTTAIRVRGSPDISKPLSVTIALHKKKPFTMTMQRTGQKPAPKRAAKAPPAPTPPADVTHFPEQEEAPPFGDEPPPGLDPLTGEVSA